MRTYLGCCAPVELGHSTLEGLHAEGVEGGPRAVGSALGGLGEAPGRHCVAQAAVTLLFSSEGRPELWASCAAASTARVAELGRVGFEAARLVEHKMQAAAPGGEDPVLQRRGAVRRAWIRGAATSTTHGCSLGCTGLQRVGVPITWHGCRCTAATQWANWLAFGMVAERKMQRAWLGLGLGLDATRLQRVAAGLRARWWAGVVGWTHEAATGTCSARGYGEGEAVRRVSEEGQRAACGSRMMHSSHTTPRSLSRM